jgi:salicylate hydroxylase
MAVIGAGIADLAVAAGLARCDVDVRVYEQSGDFDELGAGIQISPNGSRLLHRLGLGPLLERCSVRPQAIEMRRWDAATIAATV